MTKTTADWESGVFRSRPSHSSPTSTNPTTFGAYNADEQIRSALGPPGCGQDWQAPRSALTHEQSHFAVDPTLMQPEPASGARPLRGTPGNGVLNWAILRAPLPGSRLFLPSCNTKKQKRSIIETKKPSMQCQSGTFFLVIGPVETFARRTPRTLVL